MRSWRNWFRRTGFRRQRIKFHGGSSPLERTFIMNIRAKVIETIKYTSRPLGETVALFGIVDNLGIDQIVQVDDDLPDYSEILTCMRLRCRLNSARNARIFTCLIKKKYIPKLDLTNDVLYNILKERSVAFTEDN